jgi:hypothetical protein
MKQGTYNQIPVIIREHRSNPPRQKSSTFMPLFTMVKERIIKNWSCDKYKRNINHEKNKLDDPVGFNSSIKIFDIKEKCLRQNL